MIYALWAGLTSAVSCRCCISPAQDDQLIDAEEARRSAVTPRPSVTSVVASFDAWLYADSKALWAVLISNIFYQVD